MVGVLLVESLLDAGFHPMLVPLWFHGPMARSHEVEMVRSYLRAQNMEQLGRTEEALDLYEEAVEGGFDATGPYDRLIYLYSDQARHHDVIRVSELALENVRTYEDKRDWYRRMAEGARERLGLAPRAVPRPPVRNN
jgi:hypothetical protein